MLIESPKFGTIEASEEDVIHFSEGLPGFPDEKAFILLPYGPDSPFAFLQSTTEPNLIFLLVQPFPFFKDYEFELDDESTAKIGLAEGEAPQIFTVVTIKDKLEDMTTNLLAPVVIGLGKRKGIQIVLEKTGYTTQHRLFPQGFSFAKPGGDTK